MAKIRIVRLKRYDNRDHFFGAAPSEEDPEVLDIIFGPFDSLWAAQNEAKEIERQERELAELRAGWDRNP